MHFYDDGKAGYVGVMDRLSIGFRPVMTQQCSIEDFDGKPSLADFEISNPASLVPRWLRIDYPKGEWRGEFGYGRG